MRCKLINPCGRDDERGGCVLLHCSMQGIARKPLSSLRGAECRGSPALSLPSPPRHCEAQSAVAVQPLSYLQAALFLLDCRAT